MGITVRSNTSWVLETARTAYAFGVNAQGQLAHSYWGARLPYTADYPAPVLIDAGFISFHDSAQTTPLEYPGYAGANYVEPTLKVTFADGVRDVVLRVTGFALPDGGLPELVVQLTDANYPLRVDLHYRVHEAYDLIERWVEIANPGDDTVRIERIFSAQWHLPLQRNYHLSHLSGHWLNEFHLHREPLTPGVKVRESRRITTSHNANPWFAVDDGSAGEEQGELWFGVLEWSGNWKLAAEVTDFGSTRLSIGLNDWDFVWVLEPGERFVTPPALGGYTQGGFGAASRTLHDYVRQELLPHGPQLHQVLYNSWEATVLFDVAKNRRRPSPNWRPMGVELFVMDDGWFHRRNIDNAGLGDWWPDAEKFPNGLTPLIERVNALGMEFGLWIEPEMVNPNSDLYRRTPTGSSTSPRARTERRNQLILNFGRADVQEYILDKMDRPADPAQHPLYQVGHEPQRQRAGLARRRARRRASCGCAMSTGSTMCGARCAAPPAGALAELLRRRRARRHGMLRLADQIWVSDNTDPVARLNIQQGFSQLFPAIVTEAWVTEMGDSHIPLRFRFHVSMLGSLGVGGNLHHWTPAMRSEAGELVALYKQIRPLVQLGDQYRLHWVQNDPFVAVQYVAKDQAAAVLFLFRTHMPLPSFVPPVYLRGLDPAALYSVEGFEEVRSGAAWMHAGLRVELQDMESKVLRVVRM
jgi:alpha-galactosidase